MSHFGDELDYQIFDDVNTFSIRVLVIAESVHHTSQFFAEKPLTAGTVEC